MEGLKPKSEYDQLVVDDNISHADRLLALSRCTDDQILSLLNKDVRELNARVLKAEQRLKAESGLDTLLYLIFSLIGFLATFVVAIWPYASLESVSIPAPISYLSAFVVVFFGYAVFVAYQKHEREKRVRTEARLIVLEGRRSLDEVRTVLDYVRDEIGDTDEPIMLGDAL